MIATLCGYQCGPRRRCEACARLERAVQARVGSRSGVGGAALHVTGSRACAERASLHCAMLWRVVSVPSRSESKSGGVVPLSNMLRPAPVRRKLRSTSGFRQFVGCRAERLLLYESAACPNRTPAASQICGDVLMSVACYSAHANASACDATGAKINKHQPENSLYPGRASASTTLTHYSAHRPPQSRHAWPRSTASPAARRARQAPRVAQQRGTRLSALPHPWQSRPRCPLAQWRPRGRRSWWPRWRAYRNAISSPASLVAFWVCAQSCAALQDNACARSRR